MRTLREQHTYDTVRAAERLHGRALLLSPRFLGRPCSRQGSAALHRFRQFVGAAVLATAILTTVSTNASARERELWNQSHRSFVFNRDTEADVWYAAASRMSVACERGTKVRKALGLIRVPNPFASHLKRLVGLWPTVYRAAGYDDACAIASDFTMLGIEISGINRLCGNVLPCRSQFDVFYVYDRGVKLIRTAAPDVCRWEMGLVSHRPSAVIKTPCG